MLPSKLPQVGTTIFTVMSKMALDHGAINLSQGFPNFNCYPFLIDLVNRYMRDGFNQYAPMSGVPIFKQRIAEKTYVSYGISVDAEHEITVVSGATEAIFSAVTAVVSPGDEVILLEPSYDSYAPAVELSGGIPVYVPLRLPDFSVDWDRVAKAINDRTRLIMVNTPHNPCGYVWTNEDLENLASLIQDRNIHVVSDEVYEYITFDGRSHLPLMSHPMLRERTFTCGSFGKTFHVTGWKIGFCIAPPALTMAFRKIHQFVTFSTATPLQHALAEFLMEPSRYQSLPDFYQKKRDLFCEGLKNTAFQFTPAQGSFFQIVSYGNLSKASDYGLSVKMCQEIGVACIPVSVFYHDKQDHKLLRFCFAKDDTLLKQALGLLQGLDWAKLG